MSIITRLRRGLSALGALAAIATLLAGVPVFLWKTVGRPLPTRLPSWGEFSSALTHTEIPVSALTKTLACFGWIAWGLIAVSIGVEVTAWLAGTTARQLRFAGPLQPLARSLVASAAVLITLNPLSSSSFAAATSMPGSLALVQATANVSAAPHRDLEPTKGDQVRFVIADRTAVIKATEDPPGLAKQQVVQRHDTLWDLAERHLGDPYRWNEIWDLNCGKTQADGSVFTDAHWIRPGWVLVMPADAAGVAEVASIAPVTPIQPSNTEGPPPATVPTTQPGAVDPAAVTSPPAAMPTTIRPTETSIAQPAASLATDPKPAKVSASHPGAVTSARFPNRVPWVGGGLCAAGLVGLLDQLRRAQRRRRKPGEPLHNPPTELAPLETGLRRSAAASEERCQLLDAALRAFAAGAFGNPAMRTPRLLAVRSYPDSVELLLDEPLEGSVLGFTAQSDNRLWVTEPGLTVELLQRLADEVGAPYPALVTLGEVDGGDLLVDVETAGMLSVHADDGAARDLFRRVAIELATSRWGEYFEVITVGDVPDFAGFERNRRLPTVSDALDALAASAREIDESLLALGARATVAPRVSFALGDGWVPSIFVTDHPLAAGDLERLRSIVGDGGCGVGAFVLASGPQGHWTLSCVDGGAHLTPLDIHLTPLSTPMAHADAIEELLHDAAVGHLDAVDLPPSANFDVPGATAGTGREVLDDEPGPLAIEQTERDEIVSRSAVLDDGHAAASPPIDHVVPMVRVLGAVGIDNIDHEGRRKVVELIVYLALHPDGVGADRLTEALWPDAAPEPRTLTRNVCYARKALGLDADGNNHLPRINTEGRYRLGPHVRCDLLELIQLAKNAREAEDTDTRLGLLGEALGLVRDKPFDSVIDYEWAWTENWVAVAESEAADAAVLLAQTQLAIGRDEEAVRAALVGLRAAPDDARLQQFLS